jgi:Domain of Unknown Function (DUF1080)
MRTRIALLLNVLIIASAIAADKSDKKHKDQWQPMFDGSTLDGWKAGDNPQSWTVKDGSIRGDGPRSHLFYMTEKCINCEFKAEVRLNHSGNSGMYVRAQFGPGFPKGYEAQVENTSPDPVRTGSLYNFVKVFEQLIPDDTWWTQHVIIEGNHIQIFVNDKQTVDFIDEKNTYTSGYLALQQHNAGSVVEFKNLMMKVLPPPKTPLVGTWHLKPAESRFSVGEPPKQLELRILEERDGIRYQSENVREDGHKTGSNYFARLDGLDYVLAGSPDYDHISIEEIDRNHIHEALKVAKVRKKPDEHYYLVIQRRGFVEIGRATYTISADRNTLRREGTIKHDKGDTLQYTEVFEKAEP